MKKGIIFDMDGTLWDSAEKVAESWQLVLEEAGYKGHSITVEDMKSVMGKTMTVIGDILFSFVTGDERARLLKECCEKENDYLREHGGSLYPKLRETMEQLKKDYHLYIVSNCQAGYIEAFLDYYGFGDLFEDTLCFGDNGLEKAENIRLICEKNQLDDAVYVGDIQGDYDATMKAGKKFIHAAYGFGVIDHPVPSVQCLEELLSRVPEVL